MVAERRVYRLEFQIYHPILNERQQRESTTASQIDGCLHDLLDQVLFSFRDDSLRLLDVFPESQRSGLKKLMEK